MDIGIDTHCHLSSILQENDQLNQDKCELVAMVEKLKQDLQGLLEENRGLRTNSDHLKRWIGKHAAEFGLNKYLGKKDARNVHGLDPTSDSPLLHGDPALPSADHQDDSVEKLVAKTPPSSPRNSRSPTLAAGLNVSVHHHVPWQVPSSEKRLTLDSEVAEAVSSVFTPKPTPPQQVVQLPESQLMPTTGNQPIVVILQDGNGQQIMGAPEMQQETGPGPLVRQIIVEPQQMPYSISGRTQEDLRDMNENHTNASNVQVTCTDGNATPPVMDPSKATAVESLLKLFGYKSQGAELAPKETQKALPAQDTTYYSHGNNITMPVSVAESTNAITMTTTSEAKSKTTGSRSSSPPTSKMFQWDLQKLIEAGYVVPVSTGSPTRAID